LLQDVVAAESRLNNNQAAQMLEANEQLVEAALRHQADAQSAAQALSDAARSAETDPLTNLPNRARMRDRLAQAMAGARRRASRLALLFLDLDDFKQVNDRLGHAAGDEVLREVALRLGRAVREADTVSRHGGDEFLILLNEVSQAADAALIAAKLLAALGEPLRMGDRDLRLTASIGISLYPDDADSIEALIGQADAAMYRAKSKGPGGLALHGEWAAPPPAALTAHEQALAAHERRHALLQEANEQLVLAALDAQELQAAAERAQQRQADFVAAVAAELGNPFAPIRVAAAMLGRAPDSEVLLPRVQALVEQQAARVTRIVNAARLRSRGRALQQPADQRDCDLAAIIDSTVNDLRQLMGLRRQRLTLTVPAGPISVRGDAERVSHVLCNLLDNASKYTPDNGNVWVDVIVQGDSAVLTVRDDGIGMTPDVLPGIFEPFGTDSRAIGFNGASTGIGLPVVRALVTELGGSVRADSAGSGRGSRFVVTLPLAGAGTATGAGAGQAAS
jgi:diguanylate cyclase (GGDEF)-like protein